ncbi:MAG TPA: hypothetical protein VM529_20860 [Gemmata sp.]|nr:hypothetical protein [Gemmata sp.]
MTASNPVGRDAGTGLVTAVGVFPGYEEAVRAVTALRDAGFREDQIGVAGPDTTGATGAHFSGLHHDPTHTRWEEGAGIGAAVGGVAGLGLGAAVALGLMSPLGPVVAGGALVALLASAGGGATVGTIVGGLIGLGIPEADAQWYVEEVEAGRVVVTVRGGSGDHAQEILDRHGANRRPPENPPAAPGDDDNAIPGNALPATPY